MAAVMLGGSLAGWCSRRSLVSLRWDGKVWWSDVIHGPGSELQSCQLEIMIDAGNWLMLRLKPDGGPSEGQFSWLPVQRRGLEAHWHALRTAIYSPRPVKEEAGTEVPLHE